MFLASHFVMYVYLFIYVLLIVCVSQVRDNSCLPSRGPSPWQSIWRYGSMLEVKSIRNNTAMLPSLRSWVVREIVMAACLVVTVSEVLLAVASRALSVPTLSIDLTTDSSFTTTRESLLCRE